MLPQCVGHFEFECQVKEFQVCMYNVVTKRRSKNKFRYSLSLWQALFWKPQAKCSTFRQWMSYYMSKLSFESHEQSVLFSAMNVLQYVLQALFWTSRARCFVFRQWISYCTFFNLSFEPHEQGVLYIGNECTVRSSCHFHENVTTFSFDSSFEIETLRTTDRRDCSLSYRIRFFWQWKPFSDTYYVHITRQFYKETTHV